MPRYIDADALKKRMLSVFEDDGIGVVLNGYWSSKLVREIIDEQPTADVVEVVRGEWIYNKTSTLWECSNCHDEEIRTTDYCPHCGAKMNERRAQ